MTENNKLERKVYSSWAYTEREGEKAAINRDIYEEIKGEATLEYMRSGYGHKVYTIVDNPKELTTDELALIADTGNLCFGYRLGGKNEIIIHTD